MRQIIFSILVFSSVNAFAFATGIMEEDQTGAGSPEQQALVDIVNKWKEATIPELADLAAGEHEGRCASFSKGSEDQIKLADEYLTVRREDETVRFMHTLTSNRGNTQLLDSIWALTVPAIKHEKGLLDGIIKGPDYNSVSVLRQGADGNYYVISFRKYKIGLEETSACQFTLSR
jgi:hypothetical protein